MRIALDTNVLAYAEGVDDTTRMEIVTTLVASLPPEAIIIPTQVLGELFNVLTRKAGRSGGEARAMVLDWQDSYATAPTTPEVMSAAMDLAATHQLRI
ncbi:MAG: PIN domain-containing protein [Thermomicrobiales bacterium]